MSEPERSGESERAGALQVIDQYAPTGWRMWLAKGFARALVGTEKGAAVYANAREQFDLIDARSIMNAQIYATAMQQVVSDPAMIERAKARLVGDTMRKTINVEATMAGAAEYLEHSLAHDDGGMSAEKPNSPPEDGPTINPDWAATWTGYAENATSDDLRDRLARVLAGEITQPGTYSRATIRLIAELEQIDLETMQRCLTFVIDNAIFKVKVDSQEQPPFDDLNTLQIAGLITDAGSTIARNWPAATAEVRAMRLPGKVWGVIMMMHIGQSLSIPIATLTRAGIAVADLLGRMDERLALRRLIQSVDPSTYTIALMGRVGPEGVILPPHEQLAPPPAHITMPPMAAAAPPFSPPIVHPHTS